MTDKFKIGQRVRIIKSRDGEMVGTLAWITSCKHLTSCSQSTWKFYGYNLEIDGHGIKGHWGNLWCVPEDWLAPIYDGNEKTTWEDCYKVTGWKPRVVEKV